VKKEHWNTMVSPIVRSLSGIEKAFGAFPIFSQLVLISLPLPQVNGCDVFRRETVTHCSWLQCALLTQVVAVFHCFPNNERLLVMFKPNPVEQQAKVSVRGIELWYGFWLEMNK